LRDRRVYIPFVLARRIYYVAATIQRNIEADITRSRVCALILSPLNQSKSVYVASREREREREGERETDPRFVLIIIRLEDHSRLSGTIYNVSR